MSVAPPRLRALLVTATGLAVLVTGVGRLYDARVAPFLDDSSYLYDVGWVLYLWGLATLCVLLVPLLLALSSRRALTEMAATAVAIPLTMSLLALLGFTLVLVRHIDVARLCWHALS